MNDKRMLAALCWQTLGMFQYLFPPKLSTSICMFVFYTDINVLFEMSNLLGIEQSWMSQNLMYYLSNVFIVLQVPEMIEKPEEKPVPVEERIEAPLKGIQNSPCYVWYHGVNKQITCYKFLGLLVQSLECIFLFFNVLPLALFVFGYLK